MIYVFKILQQDCNILAITFVFSDNNKCKISMFIYVHIFYSNFAFLWKLVKKTFWCKINVGLFRWFFQYHQFNCLNCTTFKQIDRRKRKKFVFCFGRKILGSHLKWIVSISVLSTHQLDFIESDRRNHKDILRLNISCYTLCNQTDRPPSRHLFRCFCPTRSHRHCCFHLQLYLVSMDRRGTATQAETQGHEEVQEQQ